MKINPIIHLSSAAPDKTGKPEPVSPNGLNQTGRDKFRPAKAAIPAYTAADRLRKWAGKIKTLAGIQPEPASVYDTSQAAEIVLSRITDKILRGRHFSTSDVPVNFKMTANNSTQQYAQGAAFAKLKAEIEKAIVNKTKGSPGVFLAGHNFIIGSGATGQKMTDLFIKAHKAGIPVLFSYDRAGTMVHGKGGEANLNRMKAAGIKVITNLPPIDYLDHRKSYFIGSGDGKVTAFAGGQGWGESYGGKDWDTQAAIPESQGGLIYQNPEDEPWMDHLRMVRGEAALQGAINFLGFFASRCERDELPQALGIKTGGEDQRIKTQLAATFLPKLKPTGKAKVQILTNQNWNQRPITEAWYQKISDPRVSDIRIAMPYLTDPVLREKLTEAVKTGTNLHILIPGKNDTYPAQIANKYLFDRLKAVRQAMEERHEKTGELELKELHKAGGEPNMLHLKYGIFTYREHPEADLLIDGSYNTTAVEGRGWERNQDFLIQDHKAVKEAAQRFDELMAEGRESKTTAKEKLLGLPFVIFLRPFM